MIKGSSKFRDQYSLTLLVAISVLLFSLSGYVDQIPWHDDKAYLNNALIHSGRINKEEVLGPYADERPPLFWWILTTLFILNAPIQSAKFLSPFFGVSLVILTYSFTRKLFKSNRQGFYSGLFLVLNAFNLLLTGMVLTDVPGTALSMLFLFLLYFGVEERRNSYLIISGPILALSLMMRDQNLILFPIALFYLLTKLRLNKYLRVLIAFLGSLSLGIPIIAYGMVNTLKTLSNWLTSLIISEAYSIPFTSVGMSPIFLFSIVTLTFSVYPAIDIYFSDIKKARQLKLFNFFLSVLLFFVTLYPYLWDNYFLGAKFEIEGKGVLSRLVSHQIMSETIGVGANLTVMERRAWWIFNFVPLISPPIFLFSIIGLMQMIKKRMYSQLSILTPWLLFTSGFTIFFTYLEARFLIPSLPAFVIISSKGLVDMVDWIKSKLSDLKKVLGYWINGVKAIVEVSFVLLSLFIENLVLTELYLPTKVGSVAIVDLLNKALSGPKGWFSDYLTYLEGKLTSPILNLDPIYVLESIACLAFITLFSLRLMRVNSIRSA
ncbi:MAG: glycosyltransferase family 39 protein [Candidatus Bathyarchaeia archaeon]